MTATTVSDEADGQQLDLPTYKDDTNAFNGAVEHGRDFISRFPPEILDNVLSYCVLDHDPERGARMMKEGFEFEERSHVLLSLAAMSRYFHAHVEGFCRRLLIKNKELYYFKSAAERRATAEAKRSRRSERLKSQLAVKDMIVYRFELVMKLELHCIGCNEFMFRRATMANGVACCWKCDSIVLGRHMVSALSWWSYVRANGDIESH